MKTTTFSTLKKGIVSAETICGNTVPPFGSLCYKMFETSTGLSLVVVAATHTFPHHFFTKQLESIKMNFPQDI